MHIVCEWALTIHFQSALLWPDSIASPLTLRRQKFETVSSQNSFTRPKRIRWLLCYIYICIFELQLSQFFNSPFPFQWLLLGPPMPWSSLVEGDEGCIDPSDKLLCSWQTKKIMQHMDGNIPYTFYCWADPGVHLLLLKSSMPMLMDPHARQQYAGLQHEVFQL